LGQFARRKDLQNHQQAQPSDSTRTVGTCKMTDGTNEYLMSIDIPDTTSCADSNASSCERIGEQNVIERRLLLQLCSKFEEYNFPASGFRFVPKQPGIFSTFCFVVFSMAILLLSLKNPLAKLLNKGPHLDSVDPWFQRFLDVVSVLVEGIQNWSGVIEAVLYGVIFVGAMVILAKNFKWLCLRGKRSKFAVKTSNAEWDLGESACEDYLDQYTQELVYFLSRVGKKIDYTVVFEDMDRLDDDISAHIFTRLREINHIVNAHTKKGQHIRFVFVIKNSVANALDCSKFFDFILPVIPTLNKQSAESIFMENLKKVNCDLERTMKSEWLHSQMGRFGACVIMYLDRHPFLKEVCLIVRNFFAWIAEKAPKWRTGHLAAWFKKIDLALGKCLVIHYPYSWIKRAILRICGWFSQLMKLLTYHESARNCNGCNKTGANWCFSCVRKTDEDVTGIISMAGSALTDYRQMFTILNEYSLSARLYFSNNKTNMTCAVAEQILAFQIYKHLWPQDYQNLLDGKESVLTGRTINLNDEKNGELLKKLLNSNLLSINSLHLAGFSSKRIAELWKLRLQNEDVVSIIEAMDAENPDLQRLVQEHCSICEDGTDPVSEEVLKAGLEFLVKSKHLSCLENDWFFNGRDLLVCLRVMAAMREEDYKNFIYQCKKLNEDDIFKKCKDKYLNNRFKW
jgi:hypothetical protein